MTCMITSEKDIVKRLTVTMPVSFRGNVLRYEDRSRITLDETGIVTQHQQTSPFFVDTGPVTFTVKHNHHRYIFVPLREDSRISIFGFRIFI